MATWQEFARAAPDLAAAGERLLKQYGVGLDFLATVRKDGGPRVHPVCPVLAQWGLYVFVDGRSPKYHDLRRDGRYALHAFTSPESEEFYLTGEAGIVQEPAVRVTVAGAYHLPVHDWEVLFEFHIERCLHTTWANLGTPDITPSYRKWKAGRE